MADFDEITSMLDDLVTSFEQLPIPAKQTSNQDPKSEPVKSEPPKALGNIPSYDSFLVSEKNTKKADQESTTVAAQPIKVVAVPSSPIVQPHTLPHIDEVDDDLPPPLKTSTSAKSSTAPETQKITTEQHANIPNNNAPQNNILPPFDSLDDIPPPSSLAKAQTATSQNAKPQVNNYEAAIPQNRTEIPPTHQPQSPPPVSHPVDPEVFAVQERHRTPSNVQQPVKVEVVQTPPIEQPTTTKKYVPPSKSGTVKAKSDQIVMADPSFALLDDIPPPTAKTGTIKSVVSPVVVDPTLLDDIPPPIKHTQSAPPRTGYSTVGHAAAQAPQPAPPQPTSNAHYATAAPHSTKQRGGVQGLFHSQTDQPPPPEPASEPLWKEYVSATTGKKYYFNTLTKETTWNIPGQDAKPKPPAQQAQTLQQLQEQMMQHHQEQIKVTTPRDRSASTAVDGFVGPQINYETDPQRAPRQLRQPTDGVKQFYATVELIDSSKKKLKVSEDFLVWDLMEIVAEKLDVWQVEYFALSAINVDGSDRWLRYNLSLEQERVNEGTKLVLKVKHWLSPKRLVDPQAIRLFYLQAAQNVVSGAWMCPTRVSYTLAALQMFIIYGPYNPTKHKVGFFDQDSIKSIVPSAIIGNLNSYAHTKEKEKDKDKDNHTQFSFEILQKHIIRLYSHFSSTNIRPLDAMIKYLETCRKIPFYGYTFFDIIEAGTARKLGVGKRGFILSKKENAMAFDLYTFYEISGWNQTSLGIQIRISNPDKKPLFDVSSANGYTISELLCEYYALWLQLFNNDANYKPIQPPLTLLYIPDPRMYNREVLTYHLYDTNYSRLELLHRTYLENCKTAKVVPKAKVLRQLDEYLDFEINKDSPTPNNNNTESDSGLELDLHALDLEAVHMDIIAKSIVFTLKYEAKKDYNLIENFKLRSLDISHNPLGAESISSVAQILEQTSPTKFNLLVLNLSGTKLGPKGAQEFAQALENNKTIEELNVSECELGNKGAKIILTAIKRNRNYKNLNLSNNNIEGDKIAGPLGDLFNLNSHFLALNISKNKLGDSGLIGVLTAIRKASMKNIESLDVSDTNCGSSSLKEFMIWLSVNSQLKKLNLSYNPISDKIGKRFLKIAGDGVNKLAKIDFRACQLPKDVMLELCRIIGSQKRLEEIILSANRIGKKAAEALAESISSNQNLTSLGIRDTQLKKESTISILKSLKKHPSIKVVDLAWNPEISSNEVTKDLEDLLIFSRKLEELNLAACQLTSASIATIANGLLKNNTLKMLHLDGNKLGKHLPRLAESLLKNPDNKLERLTLKKTELAKKDLAEFLHVLHEAFSNAGALQNQNTPAVLATIKLKEVNVQANELSKDYFAETLQSFPDMKVIF